MERLRAYLLHFGIDSRCASAAAAAATAPADFEFVGSAARLRTLRGH